VSLCLKTDGRAAHVFGLRPEAVFAVMVVDGVFTEIGKVDPATGCTTVVTSGIEGEHSAKQSRHYVGLAVDFRIRHVDAEDAIYAHELIRRRLGPTYFVRLESTHIHVHYMGAAVSL
jgi:hypothetical protein